MRRFYFIAILSSFLWFGCDSSGPGGGNEEVGTVKEYLSDLPTWDEFSPDVAEMNPTPTGPTVPDPNEPEVVLDVEVVDENGDLQVLEDVVYSCNVTPYTLSDNPQDIVIYNPDREILYPGALIQGKSHKNSVGGLLGLPIAERAQIRVSIPTLANDDNFRLTSPTQAEVEQAIGSMIGAATQSGLATPSAISFEQESYHSEQQFALSLGVSGKYYNFEGSATGSSSRSASETTISAQFFQRMYDVVVEPPQTPEGFFSEDFSGTTLQRQVDLGRIGPDNLPVYVSQIVYGRMMMFTITSTSTESDLRATLQAAYNGIGTSVEVSLTAQQRSILQNSKIRIASYGGSAKATEGMIRSGDWSQYFTDSAPLSTALPLSYTFRNLGDGSIASVGESTEYEIKQCGARGTAGESFSFRTAQDFALPVGTPAQALTGDFNGDDMEDILWSHKESGTVNEVVVGFSIGDGTIGLASKSVHPEASVLDGWENYDTIVGDFDNDGMDDIAFNLLSNKNRTYVGLSNGDGTFNYLSLLDHEDDNWDGYQVYVGQMDGQGGDDLVFNTSNESNNATYVMYSLGDGTFTTNLVGQSTGSGGWADYTLNIANVDGDEDDDLIWVARRSTELATWVGQTVGTSHLNLFTYKLSRRTLNGWTTYDLTIGDIDGKNGDDIVLTNSGSSTIPIHRNISNGDGTYSFPAHQGHRPADFQGQVETHLADVNGDGSDDLVWNDKEVVNRIFVGLGNDDGTFDLLIRSPQAVPDTDDWSTFDTLFLDVDNDGDEDVVFSSNASSLRLYVGLAN